MQSFEMNGPRCETQQLILDEKSFGATFTNSQL